MVDYISAYHSGGNPNKLSDYVYVCDVCADNYFLN